MIEMFSQSIITIVFLLVSFLIIYPYLIYPLILVIVKKIACKGVCKDGECCYPSVSIVMGVKNEEKNIVQRLKNLTELNYPNDRYEIIIVSDGSDDGTNNLIHAFKSDYSKNNGSIKIEFLDYSPSKGKAYAVNLGVKKSTSEIILFADCRQTYDKDVIIEIVNNFVDKNIGCVSGELCFIEDHESKIKAEMGMYWNFEKWVRKLESSTGSVIGATGAIYAIRRELYKELPIQALLDDVLTPMNIALQGFRVIFEPKAKAYDCVSKDLQNEKTRKLRTISGNWQLLNLAPDFFNPYENPLWWRFVSHKIFRLFVPFLLFIFLITCLLGKNLFFAFIVLVQLFLYMSGLIGIVLPGLSTVKWIKVASFVLVMNLTTINAFFIWCFGRCKDVWRPK